MEEFDYSLDYKNILFKKNDSRYRIGRGEQGVLLVRPYTNDICKHWRFKTIDIAKKSSKKIINMYDDYKQQKDFVDLLESGTPTQFVSFYRPLAESIKIDLFNSFDKGKKTEMKKRVRDLETKGLKIFSNLKDDLEVASRDPSMKNDICDTVEHLIDSEKRFFSKYIGDELTKEMKKLLADYKSETAIEMGTD